MPLIHNNEEIPLSEGKTLFDYADDLAVRVPTSCGRTGECHECIVEVRQGTDALNELTDSESFLRGNYRLACQAKVQDITAAIDGPDGSTHVAPIQYVGSVTGAERWQLAEQNLEVLAAH